MSPDYREKVEALFQRAADVEPDEREAFLQSQCDGDESLRERVERLLGHHDDGLSGFLESPLLMNRDQPTRPGGFIGHYRIIREIGSGGMGTVFEAEQEKPKRTVALKVIRPGVTSRKMLMRFEQEAQVLGQLQHPGIAHIYEAGAADTAQGRLPFFALELIRGRSLTRHAEQNNMGLRERLELMAMVCDAVHHAHQKGVIHRDLKPGNIMVGADGQPKILDFGIARVTDADIQLTTVQTDIGQLMGTVPYMSPEQVAGDVNRLDTRSDVYALGVILYELLSGKLPYEIKQNSIAEAARVIQEDDPLRLSAVSTAFRGDLDTIVAKVLEKDKERRYDSAASLAADIRRYLKDEPIVARPASATYRFKKFAKRNKILVGATAAVIVALTAGLVGVSIFALRESEQRRLAQQRLEAVRQARDAEARQRQRADKRFADVRQLANVLLFDIYGQIKDLPGSTKACENLVQKGLTYVDSLAAESKGDVKLQRELSAAYSQLGEIQGSPGTSNLGDTSGAMISYRKSIDLLVPLVKEHPDDVELLRELSKRYDSVSSLLLETGRTDEAIEAQLEGLKLVDRAVKIMPDDEGLLNVQAMSNANLGRSLVRTGKLKEGLEKYREYQAYAKRLAASENATPRERNNVAITTSKIAEVQAALGRKEEAEAGYRDSLQICRGLVEEFPNNARLRFSLASSHQSLGHVLNDTKRPQEAMEHYRAAAAIWDSLLDEDPENARAQRGAAMGHYCLGFALESTGEDAPALREYRIYLDRMTALLAASPDYGMYRRDVAHGHRETGASLSRLGRHQEGLAHLEKAMAFYEALAENDPSRTMAQFDQALIYQYLGQLYSRWADDEVGNTPRRIEHLALSREWFERSVKQLERMKEWGTLEPREASLADKLEEEIARIKLTIQNLQPAMSE